jgi:hypothetical protein
MNSREIYKPDSPQPQEADFKIIPNVDRRISFGQAFLKDCSNDAATLNQALTSCFNKLTTKEELEKMFSIPEEKIIGDVLINLQENKILIYACLKKDKNYAGIVQLEFSKNNETETVLSINYIEIANKGEGLGWNIYLNIEKFCRDMDVKKILIDASTSESENRVGAYVFAKCGGFGFISDRERDNLIEELEDYLESKGLKIRGALPQTPQEVADLVGYNKQSEEVAIGKDFLTDAKLNVSWQGLRILEEKGKPYNDESMALARYVGKKNKQLVGKYFPGMNLRSEKIEENGKRIDLSNVSSWDDL